MWHKFRLHFNSNILSAFFILSAAGFSILLFFVWQDSLHAQKVANLQRDKNTAMRGITGSILEASELTAQGLQLEGQSLIQDYLNFTYENNLSHNVQKTITGISVHYLKSKDATAMKESIGEWSSSTHKVSPECIDRRTEYFQPTTNSDTYLIDLSLDKCTSSGISLTEFNTITSPIAVAFGIILVWGLCISYIVRSITSVGRLLGSSADTQILLSETENIRWTDVATIAQKALQVRGQNLQYYQTLILDAQHDISKVLDLICQKHDDKELLNSISIARNIMQRLATEVRSSDGPTHDVTAHRDMTGKELSKLIQLYFKDCCIKDSLPSHLTVSILDMSLFERILVNLSSNAIKHGRETPKITLDFDANYFQFRVITQMNDFETLKLHFAKISKRIDVKNPENPVYIKLFGRTGRGLSIIKRGILKLKGQLIFSPKGNQLECGFDLPAHITQQVNESVILPKTKLRVICFAKADFIEQAHKYGLGQFLLPEEEIEKKLALGQDLEIVSDKEISTPPSSTLRILSKKERIEGIAINWLGEQKK